MKKKRGLLFNDLSIKEISSIFANIDEQIIDLHKCSSDDFLGLSADFKKYYSHTKEISGIANEIFTLLSEESNRNLFIELQSLYKDLNEIKSQSCKNLRSINNNFCLIKSFLEQLYIPIKNLKQNLSTIKFLIANINLNEFDGSFQNRLHWKELIKTNSVILNQYNNECISNEKSILVLESNISSIINGFEVFCHYNTSAFENLLNNIHYAIIFFAEKHEEVKLQIPELKLKTENNSHNISDIITNLQYQDIIKQKIEHIQKAHNKILPELQDLYEEDCADSVKEAQLYQKVKDIAGLQAAILVCANKEYQLAIEKITSTFLEIGDDMVGITSICTKLNRAHENTDDLHLIGILDKLNNSEQILTSFIERSNSYHNQIKTISHPLTFASNGLERLINLSNKYSDSVKSIIDYIAKGLEQESNLKSNLAHLDEVRNDIHQFVSTIQKVFVEISKSKDEFSSQIQQLNKTDDNNEIIKKVIVSINSVLKQVENKGGSIDRQLDKVVKLSNSTVSEIKESIKHIRYYDLFEKSIISIISDLNHVHAKLSRTKYDETRRSENLKSIKDLYTMDTEHQIHNKIVYQVEMDSSIGEESDKSKKSDEVELF